MSYPTTRHHLLAELDRIDHLLSGATLLRDDASETADRDPPSPSSKPDADLAVDELSVKQQQVREHKQFEITSGLDRVRDLDGGKVVQFDRILRDDHDTVVYEFRDDDGQWRIFDFGLQSDRDVHVR
jgi:hypothetical protein